MYKKSKKYITFYLLKVETAKWVESQVKKTIDLYRGSSVQLIGVDIDEQF
tara:strand:+ start:1224 stop:1373 length:150 start_codon:yes stop_codon:yes gene_type:complete